MNAKDAEGRFLLANPATAELMRAGSAAALIGRTDFDFYPSDLAEGFRKTDEAAMASGRSSVIEQHVVRRDGSTAWFASLKAPFVDEADRVVGLTTHNRDITDRKRLEAEHEIARQQLAVLARHDGLTGLANRRTFEEVLQQELERSERSGAPLSLLMLDVDDFKAYNDTYGHPAGDACLCRMAEALGTMMQRPGDLAARYGGEEFAAILPWTDEAGAVTVAEAVRVAIRDLGMPHSRSRSGMVTASIGIATSIGPPADTRQALIDRADRALYAAKAGGRDRVAAAGTPPSAWS
jgi:diguanylate cyclase (GGDEF)-like protein/PAS domain S-box-containing protein